MMDKTLFRFGRCEVDADTRRVRLDGHPSAIEPRAFNLLVHLIRHRRRVVTKEELFETIWPRESVSGAALARAVMKARQAIGDGGDPALIRSLPRVGYRFVVPLDDEAAAFHGTKPQRSAADALTIALLPFENATGDASLGWVELGLMALVANALGNHPKLAPVAMQSLLIAVEGARAAPTEALDAVVRKATGAKIIVRTRIERTRSAFRLDFELCGNADSEASDAVFAEKPAELGARMVAALSEKLFPDALMPDPKGLVLRDPLATESFARGMEALATHQYAKAINLFKLVVNLEPGHTAARIELLRALGNLGDMEALRLSRRLLDRAERENDLLLAARVHQALGRLYLNRTELSRAAFHLELSLRLAAGQEPADWTARTLMLQASTAIYQADYRRTAEVLQQMYRQCEISGDRVLPVAGLNMEAIIASAGGDRELAVRLSMEAARRARELRANMYLADSCDTAAWDLAILGRLGEAASCAEEGFTAMQAMGDRNNVVDYAPCLCWIYRLARAPMAAERVVAVLPDPQQLPRPEHAWRALGLLAASHGRHADAAAFLRRALDRLREVDDVNFERQTLPWLIEALILSGAHAEAEAELEIATGQRLAGSDDLRVQALHCKALLAHARGRAGEASGLLAQLINLQPEPLWLAWACIDAAWLLAEAGEAVAATRQLEQLPAALAEHPIAMAALARVRYAAGNAADALVAHQSCLKTLGTHANGYLLRLGEQYEDAGHADLPPVPVLPSRL
jgi:DNA-binding winged helix-turn-helix (wHTH) protein